MQHRSLAFNVAAAVRAELARRRVSGSELARRLEVSQAYVWRRLSGEVELSFSDLEQIANAIDSPIDDLLPAKAAA